MPSLVETKSYGTVKVFWLDRDRAAALLKEGALRLGRERAEVVYIGLFGSLAEGRAVPGSDADLVVIVEESDLRPMDRPLVYGPYFEHVGLGIDLFCYTRDELATVPLAGKALARSRPLWGENPPVPGSDPTTSPEPG